MEIIGSILMIMGGVAMFVGGIWMLIEQFKSGILWGLACLLIPFVSLIWLVTHFEVGKYPFLVSLAGLLVMFGGMALSGQF